MDKIRKIDYKNLHRKDIVEVIGSDIFVDSEGVYYICENVKKEDGLANKLMMFFYLRNPKFKFRRVPIFSESSFDIFYITEDDLIHYRKKNVDKDYKMLELFEANVFIEDIDTFLKSNRFVDENYKEDLKKRININKKTNIPFFITYDNFEQIINHPYKIIKKYKTILIDENNCVISINKKFSDIETSMYNFHFENVDIKNNLLYNVKNEEKLSFIEIIDDIILFEDRGTCNYYLDKQSLLYKLNEENYKDDKFIRRIADESDEIISAIITRENLSLIND